MCGTWLLGKRSVVAEHLESCFNGGVAKVDILVPCALVKHVVDDAAVDVTLQQFVRLLDHEVATLQSVLVGVCSKLVDEVLFGQIACKC